MVEQLKLFFTINETIVHFLQGQVFLVLGVVMGIVALQWRQHSRLELANALPWLSIFALFEAIATWGDSFIPIQARLLPPDIIQTLRFAQLIVRLLTFATLLGFGLKLTEPQVPPWAALYVPLVLVLVVSALLAIQRAIINGVDTNQNESSEALLRYLIGLPAALLVAFGLRQQAARLVGPLKSFKLIRVLRIAGFGFLFYALVEGLIAPKTLFLPASPFNTLINNTLINEQSVYEALGIPIGIFRSIVGAVIALFLFRSLSAFRIEADRLAESFQQQQSLMAERERISRDLHDGTIQSIYAAGLMLDDVHHTLVKRQQPAEAGDKLQTVMGVLNTTIQEIRGYIYDLRRSVAGDEDLTRALVDIVTEFRLRTGIPVDWDVVGCGKFALAPDRRQHVYQITREALSNISRHAKASHAKLELRYQDCVEDVAGSVQLKISDNGSGNALTGGKTGRGLLNMRERAALLDGHLEVISKSGRGTEVVLEIKCQSSD